MNTSLIFALALAAVVSGAVLLAAALRVGRNQDRALSQRVDKAIGAAVVSGRRKITARRLPTWIERFSAFLVFPFTAGIGHTWGITLKAPHAYLIGLLGALVSWLFAKGLLHMPIWLVSIACAAGALLLPRAAMAQQQRNADTRFVDFFPDAIDMVVRMVRSGLSVAIAVRAVGREAAQPVGEMFKRVADRSDIGVPLEEALADVSEEVGLPDFRFFAVTIGMQRTTGGNLTRTLETFSDIIRKRRAIRLKALAATAEVRMSAWVLGAIPFVVVGALAVINPGYLDPMISDPRGNVLLGIAVLCLTLGAVSMHWLVRSGTRV